MLVNKFAGWPELVALLIFKSDLLHRLYLGISLNLCEDIMRISKKFILLSATALSLSACSGGGGGASAPSSNITTPSSPSTTTLSANPAGADVYLGPMPTNVYPTFNQYTPTGVLQVIKSGIAGQGVKVGVMDSGVNTSVPALQGRIAWFNSYVVNGNSTVSQNDLSGANDPYGHGTVVTALLGGVQQGTYGNNYTGPVNFFPGGVAPEATIYSAQVCNSSGSCGIYSKAYQDLAAQGVHIFNNSLADNTSNFATAADAASASQSTGSLFSSLGTGNLYIWAAGNDPKSAGDISVDAEVPVYTPSLQPQWLAVANVDIGSNGQVTGLDSTSDACGVTAQWCISAPGYDQTPIVSGTSFNTGLSDGTSFATPIVTGVAALVDQKYPWFTPANLTDTILTTATPIGGQIGPNSTYGWGLVNAAGAVNGPAQFAFGNFAADIAAYQSTFSNPISGSGGLTLSGTTGTLTLSADNTYTGATTINSGNLDLTGSLASSVTVNGGSFGGLGTVNGNVSNPTGTVISQGNTGGAAGLTINGNYSAGGSATTAIAIGTPLSISGTATLAGAAEILAPPTAYTPQATETFIRAGSITGTFGAENYGAGVFYNVGNFVYGPTTVTATVSASNVAHTAAALPGATKASVAGGAALQTTIQATLSPSMTNTAGAAQFLKAAGQALSATTAGQAQVTLTSVSGEAYPTMRTVAAGEELSILDMTAEHAAMKPVSGKTTTWVRYLGDFGTYRQKGTDGVQFSSNGFMAGFDTPAAHDLTVGGAFTHLSYNGSVEGVGGSGHESLNSLDLYARYGGPTGFYGSGQISYGFVNGQIDRTIYAGSSASGTVGRLSDNMLSESAELGYQVLGINPFVSITDIQYNSGRMSEATNSGLGLTIAGQGANYAYATAGLRVNQSVFIAGHQIFAHATIGWRHKLAGADTMTASFNPTPGATFSVVGQNMPNNEALLGLALAGKLYGNWQWQAGWQASYDGQGTVANAVNAGVKTAF